MRKWIARIGLVASAIGLALVPSAASAGGWALASFDPMPTLSAGADVDVGFTVLQHGVTPASFDTLISVGHDVGVTVTDAGGTATFFPAKPSGAEGHFVATVTVPAAGAATLSAEMGLFGTSPPVDVDVTAPTGGGGGWPAWMGVLLPAVAIACLGLVVVDVLAGRRAGKARTPAPADVAIADSSA